MNPKERLIKILSKESVDRPACICPGGMMNMIVEDLMDIENVYWPGAHTNAQMMADLAFSMHKNGGFENCGVPFCMTVEAQSMGASVYLGTKNTEPRVTEYAINSSSDWKKLKNIDINAGRANVVINSIKLLKAKNSDIPIIANLTGPISLASSLLDPNVYYKELRKKKDDAHQFMSFVTDNLIRFGKAQIDAGADVIVISDPSGTGEILGAKTFNEFALVYLNKIVDELGKYAPTIIHICGRLKSIYNELNNLNSDAISFDSITSVNQVIENVEDKIIMGNVSTFALEYGDSEGLRVMANSCILNGVDILSPACGIGVKTKMDNIRAIVECAKNYKK